MFPVDRGAGATEYVLMRMDFSDGSKNRVAPASHRPGGFTASERCLVSDPRPLGRHALKGVAEPRDVFGPA